jgi:hypothetical protein
VGSQPGTVAPQHILEERRARFRFPDVQVNPGAVGTFCPLFPDCRPMFWLRRPHAERIDNLEAPLNVNQVFQAMTRTWTAIGKLT